MFGWTLPTAPRPKFAEEILGKLTARQKVTLWRDAFFSPLHVGILADILIELSQMEVSGVLNVGAREPISKAEFGRLIADVFGLDYRFVEESSVRDSELRAVRPGNVGLDVKKVTKLLGPMPTVESGVFQLYDEAFDGTAEKIRGRNTYP